MKRPFWDGFAVGYIAVHKWLWPVYVALWTVIIWKLVW